MTDQSRTDYKAVCFVDMPFGKKPDLASGVTVDFDSIYELAIKPAIREAGLEAIHGSAQADSPIYQLFTGFPAPVVPEPVEQFLKDRAKRTKWFS